MEHFGFLLRLQLCRSVRQVALCVSDVGHSARPSDDTTRAQCFGQSYVETRS
jgi:hypothetical protein